MLDESEGELRPAGNSQTDHTGEQHEVLAPHNRCLHVAGLRPRRSE